jgi:hypothetical protein
MQVGKAGKKGERNEREQKREAEGGKQNKGKRSISRKVVGRRRKTRVGSRM